ncbi:hypothetical protein [Terrabacter sp. 2RAF25]|uniref:hypothetical protein n=1 Tax=Terrabacter sp. 2RAF25 TaxID=3232998 RepID=UPI003F96AF23
METVSNLVVVKVGANGRVALRNGSTGSVQLVGDVAGYYLAPGAWRAAKLPMPSDASTDPVTMRTHLDALSCPEPGSCFALGAYRVAGSDQFRMLSETESGGVWQFSRVGDFIPADVNFTALSCATSAFCMGVGVQGDIGQGVIVRVESGIATVMELPSPNGSTPFGLKDVTCPSIGLCHAVGWAGNDSASGRAVFATYRAGAWTSTVLDSPPDRDPTFGAPELSALSCSGPDDCVAVGSYSTAQKRVFLLARLSGGVVGVNAAPLPDDADGAASVSAVQRVRCYAAQTCVVAGRYDPSATGSRPFVGEITPAGISLRRAPTPIDAIASNNYYLPGLDCPSAGACVAAGSYGSSSGPKPLVLTFTSGTWHQGTSSGTGGAGRSLADLSCPPTGPCAAVGVSTETGTFRGLLGSADLSSTFSTATAPAVPGTTPVRSDMSRVDCPAPDRCTALGTQAEAAPVAPSEVRVWPVVLQQ